MHQPTPGLPEFDYVKPTSIAEASRFLADHEGEARPFMGGTDTFVRMRDGAWRDKFLVDVKGLAGMQDITFDPQQGLTIGAAVNMNRVMAHIDVFEHYPLLVQASNTVASHQLRSRATIVGNICNASPAGDTTGACIALRGILQVHGLEGFREVPLAGFFLGPGKTVLSAGDVVTALRIPIPPNGWQGEYIKLGRNAVGDLAIVGVTALGYPDTTAASGFRFRLALASVAPVPYIPREAEEILANRPINEKSVLAAATAAQDAVTPISDTRGSARYRKLMVKNLVRKAVTVVVQRLVE
ncbi:MAG: xanthine dehydrogenase family protein subunit M [Candidatus Promineifilaceae bacterium]|nr:xanthine dehydrogenase family protein subunit M [Candidatus Promineifilaceae bacterium]